MKKSKVIELRKRAKSHFDQYVIVGKLITTPSGRGRIYRVRSNELGGIAITTVERVAGGQLYFRDYTYLDIGSIASAIAIAYSTGDELVDMAFAEALRGAMGDRLSTMPAEELKKGELDAYRKEDR